MVPVPGVEPGKALPFERSGCANLPKPDGQNLVRHGRNRTSCLEGEALQASSSTSYSYLRDALVDQVGVEPTQPEAPDLNHPLARPNVNQE